MSVSCTKIYHSRCPKLIWSSSQLISKQWIIIQFTAWADLFLKYSIGHYLWTTGVKNTRKCHVDANANKIHIKNKMAPPIWWGECVGGNINPFEIWHIFSRRTELTHLNAASDILLPAGNLVLPNVVSNDTKTFTVFVDHSICRWSCIPSTRISSPSFLICRTQWIKGSYMFFHALTFTRCVVSNFRQLFAADNFSRRHFQMHFFLVL